MFEESSKNSRELNSPALTVVGAMKAFLQLRSTLSRRKIFHKISGIGSLSFAIVLDNFCDLRRNTMCFILQCSNVAGSMQR